MNKVVVIQYEEGWVAPKVLLKERGILAHRVVETGEKAGVQILQDSELLERLWHVPLGNFIEEELFDTVARVLAFVYGLEGKEAGRDGF